MSDHLPFEALIGNNILERYLNKLDYRNRYAEFRASNNSTIRIPFGNNLRKMAFVSEKVFNGILNFWQLFH